MALVLTEEQIMLRDTAASFAAESLPLSRLRQRRDAGVSRALDQEIWSQIVAMGWTGVMVPEDLGGSDFGAMGLGQVLEQIGRSLAPVPLLSTALVGVSALRLGASAEQAADWLSGIAGGEVRIALAVDEGPHHTPLPSGTRATRDDASDPAGWRLGGAKRFVADATTATHFLVSARIDAAQVGLFLVAPGPGVKLATLDTVDAHGAGHLELDNAQATRLSGGPLAGEDLLQAVLDHARIGLAAEMLGAADAAFAMTLDYLKTRKQFGQLIGSFQALQHRAAIQFSELELTRSCVMQGLSVLDDLAHDPGKAGRKLAEAASLAKARAADTLHLVSNETIQFHGGIGMTDAFDAGFFLKRARVQEHLYGSAGFHRDRFASLNGV